MRLIKPVISTCLERVDKTVSNLNSSEYLAVDSFNLRISATDYSMIKWVKSYLYPLALPRQIEKRIACRFSINCIHSDELVTRFLSAMCNKSESINTFSGYGNRKMLACDYDDNIQFFVAPEEGLVWVFDKSNHSLNIVYSSRTQWPSLEFARSVRDIISHLLNFDGWTLCHAGAVQTATGNYLVIGDSGAGKTTLILALLENGARFVANELLFAKTDGDLLKILPFQIPVAIGMGTALQFEAITALVHSPYHLLYPPRRFRASRLAKTSHRHWYKMKDKIQILPSELESVFPFSRPMSHLQIDKMIVPQISLNPVQQTFETLSPDKIAKIVKNNLISFNNKKFNAPWFKSNPTSTHETTDDLIHNIKALPATKLMFHVHRNQTQISI